MRRVIVKAAIMTGTLVISFLYAWNQALLACAAGVSEKNVRAQYEEFESRFAAVESLQDIEANGFQILEGQVFNEVFESFGEEPLTFIATKEEKYNRIALFLVNAEEEVVYKCNRLETNNCVLGRMEQNTKKIAAVSFVDLNGDNKKDIILITRCMNDTGEYSDKLYKVGDVLFQGRGSFYRDYRISETINRFSMNKSAKCVVSYVRDGESTEFLYTSTTKEELLENGFVVEEEQCYYREFEKLGRLQVVPGIFEMGDYDVFMIYLIDTEGNIVWSFQPMGDYDNLYSLRGISGKDVDGDGMKDLVVLARYSYESAEGTWEINTDCAVYYQRTGGFDVDTEFVEQFECTDDLTMEALVNEIRIFWGWDTEEIRSYLIEKNEKKQKTDKK